MPFLLRCWLITSIGEKPATVRLHWAKEEAPPAREVQAGLIPFRLTINIFIVLGDFLELLEGKFFSTLEV